MPDVGAYKAAMKALHGDAPDRERQRVREEARRREEAERINEELREGPRHAALSRAATDAFFGCMDIGLKQHLPGWQDRAVTPEQIEAVRQYREAEAALAACPRKE